MTCGDRCIDFFVIERRLRPYVVAVQRLEGAGTSPHCPVRILLDGACRRDLVRTVRSPASIGACLPKGCLSEESASAAPVLETCADEQLRGTYGMAEAVAAEVLAVHSEEARGFFGRAEGCSYKWKPYCTPRAVAGAKVSALTIAWRTGAATLRRLQLRHGGPAWWHGVAGALGCLHRAGSRALGDERRAWGRRR